MTVAIIDTTLNNVLDFGLCGYKDTRHPGLPRKIAWLEDRFAEGMKVKTLYSDEDGAQGMVEYIPGEYCWRPVEASGYMFIHCIFVGFKRVYKEKGYGSLLLGECESDARAANMRGIAIVARKGPFMAGKELFLNNGFEIVDEYPSDFWLLVKRFAESAPPPRFKGGREKRLKQYGTGLVIFRSDQCPYLAKCVPEMIETAEREFGVKPEIIDVKSCWEAQANPCAFGSFAILLNGKLVAEHPISKSRFANIMKKELEKA